MALYYYRLIDKENKIRTGKYEALTKRAAQKALSSKGETVLLLARENPGLKNILNLEIPLFGRGFSKLERIIFFRNFSSMLSVGVSMTMTLNVLAEQTHKKRVNEAISAMRRGIENGRPLSRVMADFPEHFPEYMVETVKVGEFTGDVSKTLDQISSNLERDYEISRKVYGAIAYPLVVIAVMIAVLALLLTTVLPKIAEIFSDLDADPPSITLFLIKVGIAIERYPWHIAGTIILFLVGLLFVYRTKRGRYLFHYIFLRLPIFGILIKEFNLVRFFRSLDSLFSSGISLVNSVEIGRKTMKNVVYKTALESVHPALMHGAPLTEVIKPFPKLFSSQIRRVLEVGEQAGKYDETFANLTRYFERSIQHRISIMNSMLEPILMLLVGIVVGGLALSIFLPIYRLSSVI